MLCYTYHTHTQTQGGANHGLLARGVCQLISVSDKSSKGKLTTNKDNVCIDKVRACVWVGGWVRSHSLYISMQHTRGTVQQWPSHYPTSHTLSHIPPPQISVRRFYHPEDVDQDLAYKAASHWEVYYSNTEVEVSVDDIVGKCTVGGKGTLTGMWVGGGGGVSDDDNDVVMMWW